MHVLHRRAQVAPAYVHIDPAGQAGVLTAQHGRPIGDADIGHIRENQALATLCDDRQYAQLFQRIPDFPGIAQVDRETLQTLNCLADVLTTDRRRDDRLHIGNVQTEARSFLSADVDVHIAPSRQALRQGAAHTRHVFHCTLNFTGDAVNLDQISPGHFDTHRALDAGSQHIDAVANRRHPNIGQAGYFDNPVQFLHQLVLRHAGSPLLLGFELNGSFEHLHGSGVGRGLGPSGFAVNRSHFRYGLDQAVGLLQ